MVPYVGCIGIYPTFTTNDEFWQQENLGQPSLVNYGSCVFKIVFIFVKLLSINNSFKIVATYDSY